MFKEIVKEIGRLNSKDQASHSERMCKVMEEIGELAQAVNRTTGRKILKEKDTVESMNENLLEEGVDSIQCIISLLKGYGYGHKDILKKMKHKNKVWESVIEKKKKIKKK
jgi:NTP pyrophosphatase (non-canonical NTP hydrolase)